jgi:hypothetical protein
MTSLELRILFLVAMVAVAAIVAGVATALDRALRPERPRIVNTGRLATPTPSRSGNGVPGRAASAIGPGTLGGRP